jgi:hypothetical protein
MLHFDEIINVHVSEIILIFRAKFFLFNGSDVNEECFLCGFRENKIFI